LSGKFRELADKGMSWVGGTKPAAPVAEQPLRA
jgi:hypothetical protein